MNNIADMDSEVGAILKQLEDDGLADNTIVFYWSDHGDGVPRAKRSLYDSGLRVPLMIRWPKALAPPFAPARVTTMKIGRPTEVTIHVPTQGASIGYTTEDGPSPKWRISTGPILIEKPLRLRAKAIRYGYKESAESSVTFTQ